MPGKKKKFSPKPGHEANTHL